MLPKHCPIFRRNADHACSIQQNDLLNAADCQKMWRAVAGAFGWSKPAWVAGGNVVSSKRARSCDDHSVTNDQRRTRKTPPRHLLLGVRRSITRPDDRTVTSIERVQDSCSTERINTAVVKRRCPAWPSARVRLVEPGRVAVSPNWLTCSQVVTRDEFVFTTLFLRVDEIVLNCERRPTRSDWLAPKHDWRFL